MPPHRSLRIIPAAAFLLLVAFVACSDGTGPPACGNGHVSPDCDDDAVHPAGRTLEIVTGAGFELRTSPGVALVDTIRVRLLGARGRPVVGAPVRWEVTQGGGSVHADGVTDASGEAAGVWTLGGPGAQELIVGSPGAETMRLPATAAVNRGIVQGVYLVPADREFRAEYAAAIGQALGELRLWYQAAMGDGLTFTLGEPAVIVHHSMRDAQWFTVPAHPEAFAFAFFYNALEEARLAPGLPVGPEASVVVFVDAEYACGQGIFAAGLATAFPAHVLRGLSGEAATNPCTGEESQVRRGFTVGLVGHELGHTFSLDHPCNGGAGCPERALMWTGFGDFPDAVLLRHERRLLAAGAFFAPQDSPHRLP
jgi:hypothetical protein